MRDVVGKGPDTFLVSLSNNDFSTGTSQACGEG